MKVIRREVPKLPFCALDIVLGSRAGPITIQNVSVWPGGASSRIVVRGATPVTSVMVARCDIQKGSNDRNDDAVVHLR